MAFKLDDDCDLNQEPKLRIKDEIALQSQGNQGCQNEFPSQDSVEIQTEETRYGLRVAIDCRRFKKPNITKTCPINTVQERVVQHKTLTRQKATLNSKPAFAPTVQPPTLTSTPEPSNAGFKLNLVPMCVPTEESDDDIIDLQETPRV